MKIMKVIIKGISLVCMGLFLSMASCNNKSESAQENTDSTTMSTEQSEMGSDTTSVDSARSL
jgi:ABC-type oligopeptide transport system substrate-binding subunit